MSNRAKELVDSHVSIKPAEGVSAKFRRVLRGHPTDEDRARTPVATIYGTHPGNRLEVAARVAAPAPTSATDVADRNEPNVALGGALKRATDIVLSAAALIILSPVFLITALLVRLLMGGPVLYFHERVGHNGRTFRCYKFRSMVTNADEVLARHLAADPAARTEWLECQKLKVDPRVPPFGRLLRVTSLDELPQIFNILRGDMSCVGPRPVTNLELKRYGDFKSDYLTTRPGLTGLWQINGRSALSYEERIRLDVSYIRNWSWLSDATIMLKTIPALLRKGESF